MHVSRPLQGYLFSIKRTTPVQKARCWKFTKKALTLIWSGGGKYLQMWFHNMSDWSKVCPATTSLLHPPPEQLLFPLSRLYSQSQPAEWHENFSFWLLYFSKKSIPWAGDQVSSMPVPAPGWGQEGETSSHGAGLAQLVPREAKPHPT